MKYSSFTKRALAMIFDLALMDILVSFVADSLLPLLGYSTDFEKLTVTMEALEDGGVVDAAFLQQVIVSGVVLSVIAVAALVVFDAILPATKLMGSPGKAVLGMVIVDADGKRLGFSQSFGRHAAKFVSSITLFGFLMPLWSDKKQSLHDKMAHTYVVQKKGLVV